MTDHLRKKFLLLMMLLGANLFLNAQEIDNIKVDPQGSVYTVISNEVHKTNPDKNFDFTYSNKLVGNLHDIDVYNTLRPLLFFKESQKVIITDNTMSERSQEVINLDELELYQVECVASSRIDNGIWLFDLELYQIVKVDRTFERQIETGNLKQILGLDNLSPIDMIERNGFLYLRCKNNGILVFDIYGTYYKTIAIQNTTCWNIVNQELLYVDSNSINYMNLQTLEFSTLQIEKDINLNKINCIDASGVFVNDDGKVAQINFNKK